MIDSKKPWILGISSSHNGAACLLKGNEIVAAVQEERLTRVKRQRISGALPSLAVNYCLEHAAIKASELNLIAYCVPGKATDPLEDVALHPQLQAVLHKIPVVNLSHHMAHAVSAFALSGFDDSAILVVDGVGSPEGDLSAAERGVIKNPMPNGSEAISLYSAQGTSLTPLSKHLVERGRWVTWDFLRMPRFRSLGGIFSAAAWQIFGNHLEAGKVMGLAPYGEARFAANEFFEIVDGSFEYKDLVPARFEHADRWPERQSEYQDLSASCQAALEEALMWLVGQLREIAPIRNLSYAGGVALNSVANERIIRESGFADVFIIPAAEDSGCAIGAAYHGLWQLTGKNGKQRLLHDAVGRPYSRQEIAETIARTPGIVASEPSDPLGAAVDLLCSGKIIGWFHGRSELGPRALGQRSILCDPRSPDAKAILNRRVKHREEFRPFAPVIPLEEAANWFEMDGHDLASPYMLRICHFQEAKRHLVPAVVHVDGTGRIQTVTPEGNGLFYQLVKRFHQETGVPIVLNTSFNVMDEPIVETPEDAIWCFLSTGIDAVVFEDRIVSRRPGLGSILDFYPYLSCSRIAESRLVHEERIGEAAKNTSFVTFSVRTPWGRTRQIASPNVLPVLSLIDGRTSGWSLLAQLSNVQATMPDSAALVRSLELWRKSSQGEVLIDGTTSATDIVQTLFHQRISAYDESNLIRMLVRLRRHYVIGFREKPQEAGA